MVQPLSINRACLRENRPVFLFFMYARIFPKTDTNTDFPGALAINNAIRALFDSFFIANGKREYFLADEIYDKIIVATIGLMDYIVLTAVNNKQLIINTGFSVNKQTKTAAPLTSVPVNLSFMALGDGKFSVSYTGDEYANYFVGRTRLRGAPDTDWKEGTSSQTETMLFTDYTRKDEIESQIAAVGTAGQSDWSASVFVVIS